MKRLGRRFFARDALDVAPELLNKILVVGPCAGRIVEVEAYRRDDPASHSFAGPTARNAVMFAGPGQLYVYFTYGMHYCANVVTGRRGEGSAVLVRALAPLRGVDVMVSRRPTVERDLTNGPAKLCAAFGIDRSFDGVDLVRDATVLVADDATPPPERPGVSSRIGISRGLEAQWRFFVDQSPHVSRHRRSPPRSSP